MTLFTNNIMEHMDSKMTNDDVLFEHEHDDMGDTDSVIDNNKPSFITNKLNILDRQVIILNNYSIINKNHIYIFKMFTVILVIMIAIYALITYKVIPKIIASIILALLSIIFYFLLLNVIIKNIRLYRMNREDIYYPKDNPMNIYKTLFGKKCVKPAYLDGSDTLLESLIDILKEAKEFAITYNEFDYAQSFHNELMYILDNVSKSNSTGPFENDDEIVQEITKYTEDLEDLRSIVKQKQKKRIANLKKQADIIKRTMAEYSDKIDEEKDDEENTMMDYKLNEKKYNEIIRQIKTLRTKMVNNE